MEDLKHYRRKVSKKKKIPTSTFYSKIKNFKEAEKILKTIKRKKRSQKQHRSQIDIRFLNNNN